MREASFRSVRLNGSLVAMVLALSAIGLINLYSATYVWDEQRASSAFYSQIVWMSVGWAICLVVWRIDYQLLERFAYPIFAATLMGLMAVLLLGEEIAGHQSWLRFGSLSVQPSEFAKIGFLLALAKYFSAHSPPHGFRTRELQWPLLLVALPLGLILLEGDLGSGLFFLLIFSTLILFVGVRRKTLAILTSVGLFSVIGAYFFLLNPYQRMRIQTFMQPALDPRGQGYQLIQSKIAVGSGLFFGKGYLQGMQNKLLYLPEKHTDFVFPVLAEEWGFVGSAIVILLFLGLIVAGIDIAAKTRDRFGMFLALGITALLFWQVVINVGGVLGILPLTGVTLPLLSYGSSSLVTVFLAIGVLLNVSSRRYVF